MDVSQCNHRLQDSLQDTINPYAGSWNMLDSRQQAQHRQQPNGHCRLNPSLGSLMGRTCFHIATGKHHPLQNCPRPPLKAKPGPTGHQLQNNDVLPVPFLLFPSSPRSLSGPGNTCCSRSRRSPTNWDVVRVSGPNQMLTIYCKIEAHLWSCRYIYNSKNVETTYKSINKEVTK